MAQVHFTFTLLADTAPLHRTQVMQCISTVAWSASGKLQRFLCLFAPAQGSRRLSGTVQVLPRAPTPTPHTSAPSWCTRRPICTAGVLIVVQALAWACVCIVLHWKVPPCRREQVSLCNTFSLQGSKDRTDREWTPSQLPTARTSIRQSTDSTDLMYEI